MSERLTTSFLRDLRTARLFTEVGTDRGADLTLKGRVLVLGQSTSRLSSPSGDAVGAVFWSGLVLLGVPTQCGNATVSIVLQAYHASTDFPLRCWQVQTEATDCAGMYYGGWPLGKALKEAAAKLLDDLRADAPGLKLQVEQISRTAEPTAVGAIFALAAKLSVTNSPPAIQRVCSSVEQTIERVIGRSVSGVTAQFQKSAGSSSGADVVLYPRTMGFLIADALRVATHLSRAVAKLGVASRGELIQTMIEDVSAV